MSKRILHITAMVMILLFVTNSIGYADTKNDAGIMVGGQTIDLNAIESGDEIYLPLRALCDALGYSVEWSGESRTVTVKTQEKTVLFDPGNNTVNDGGHSYYAEWHDISDSYIGAGCLMQENSIYVSAELMKSCFRMEKFYDSITNTYKLAVQPKSSVSVENKRITAEDEKQITNIQYPVITIKSQEAAEKINAAIFADAEKAQQELQESLADYPDIFSPNRYECNFNYKIAFQQDGLLSIVLWDYQYYGGAHGSTRQITHTFDLQTGKEYSLADLMRDNSGYADYISSQIRERIANSDLAENQLVKFVSIAENQSYYLSDNGLMIYFQQYEYFPYAAGIQEYRFQYEELADLLKPEFNSLCSE